ncbi:unnamed protein product [Schistocephalus solidus]|uniref:Glycine--tRNA ligase n=1 Tax=Schistocephalus solidus TaxID=70667 RepID=A0A183SP59_SCHSO|nr:unnamed protein product [Schistocephalus solidus]
MRVALLAARRLVVFLKNRPSFCETNHQVHHWCSKVTSELSKSFPSLPVMTDIEEILSPLRAEVQVQGDIVRQLKANKASDGEIKRAVTVLKAKKRALDEKVEIELRSKDDNFDRSKLEDLLKQKFFYDQSFSIYGGVQGLYDFGPTGCAIKANILSAWRQFFVLEEQLLEVDCSVLTPESVLKASGHVDRFTDYMVKDTVSGECFRVDHLIEAALEIKLAAKDTKPEEKVEINRILAQLDNYGAAEFSSIIEKYNIKSPNTKNDLTPPQQFNLMFSTLIGPTGQCRGYLRPETAQGIFVNFQRLLQFNQGRLPFGAAQIGPAFRNEISPRAGVIRVREFTMAEIEYFVDPNDKRHPKFSQYAELPLNLLTACDQMDGKSARKITLGEAVSQGVIANETLGYFMARIFLFLYMIGVDVKKFRFRQHMKNEMAHYACDCWDAECRTSYGWVECVGCADRSCYDLTQHTKATGARLVAERPLAAPVINPTVFLNLLVLKPGVSSLSLLSLEATRKLKTELEASGDILPRLFVSFTVDEIVPSVIEPSFGIGRIMYAILEHNFKIRENDQQRTFLSLPPVIAPYKCSVLPLSSHPDFAPFVPAQLTRVGISHRVDESGGSIGRRYARTDQIAIPYGITVDFDTVNQSPPSATLRERDTMKQIRLEDLPDLVSDLVNGVVSWTDALLNYPIFEQQESGK